jgi:hypothetical protein
VKRKLIHPSELPAEVVEAAKTLEMYFKERNVQHWQVMGVCSFDLCVSARAEARMQLRRELVKLLSGIDRGRI